LTLRRATEAGLDWEAARALSDEALDARLYGAPAGADPGRFLPDFAAVHAEHKRPGVTLELLHLEYLEQHPDGYLYTQFCEYYRRWLKRRRLSMRQIHRAGEKLFVDYAGKRPQRATQCRLRKTETSALSTSPAATPSTNEYKSSGSVRSRSPFKPRNTSAHIRAVRLFPSTNG
jgi:transposase